MPPQHPSSRPGGRPVPGRHFDGLGNLIVAHLLRNMNLIIGHIQTSLGPLPDSKGMRVEILTIQEITMGEVLLLLSLQEGKEEATLDHVSY